MSVCNQARLSHGDAGYWRSRRSGPATLCFPRNLANFLGLAKVTKGGRSGRPAGLTGPPVASPFLPGVPKPRGPRPKVPRGDPARFSPTRIGFQFLPLGMARGGSTARGPKGCALDYGGAPLAVSGRCTSTVTFTG